jgi:DNA-directed RNA polymerase subunit M/transcription elongation factor TFIIS
MESNSDIKCKKCKKNVYEYSRQTRSADEPATDFYKCINPDCPLYGVEYKK